MNKLLGKKNRSLFSAKDVRQIERFGLDLQSVEKQLSMHRSGPTFIKLNRPCAVHDGIFSFSTAQQRRFISLYDQKSGHFTLQKFVPASGAASRMFSEWFAVGSRGSFGSKSLDERFIRHLEQLPFYDRIAGSREGRKLLKEKNIGGLLKYILSSDGLHLGKHPKALVPFHRYHSKDIRTPMEEHIAEAALYTVSQENESSIHFTLSPGFKSSVTGFLKTVVPRYSAKNKIRYKISLSLQALSTNTIALDENQLPFRDETGKIVFRPGGHGALLGNLNSLDADFIFVRNIDNIAPETLWGKIIPYRKMLGGLAISIREEIISHIRQLKNNNIRRSQLDEIIFFCSSTLNIVFPHRFLILSMPEKIRTLLSALNRPLRVCGMVKNENHPGGGPFWVEEKDGTQTLQIVENAHVNMLEKDQADIWSGAGYFNPVDMVCCIKDYRGKRFNLRTFVNHDTYLITSKHEKGRELKALEVPGLWNGSMAYWNTVFVRLPVIVFNPVKTVYDLLCPGHRVW